MFYFNQIPTYVKSYNKQLVFNKRTVNGYGTASPKVDDDEDEPNASQSAEGEQPKNDDLDEED